MSRKRRRIRWKRVILLLMVLLFLFTVLTSAAIFAYHNVFQEKMAVNANAPAESTKKLPERVNILLLGLDDVDPEMANGARRSDAMLVASINPEDGGVNLISIPRDTKVTIPGRKGYDKITHAYYYGGVELAKRTVEDVLDIPIDHYVAVDWKAFINVIDILGGVDLYVENDMDYEDPYANLSIHLQKGYQHLDGEKAGEYVRFRHDELGDIGRVQRQQRFLKALSGEVFQLETILKFPSIVNTINQYVNTDMTAFTMLKVANSLKSFKTDNVYTEMIPGDFATINDISYWIYDKEQTKQVVQKLFYNNTTKTNEVSKKIQK
ncbi:hypothetical protein P22_3598 [Propionispora sp. 2/2-37]|uniref:LCP family protein n=1 Tax=Propionispora sp. 2/2-37 TaxID=1677858 RepID=UPI0006BB6A05|nr:LCP family protein [Propionispora sp. 2/2-37]CUH97468.1 hypothetical protein P22_3598 [Propionispora sp. 2/2-37]